MFTGLAPGKTCATVSEARNCSSVSHWCRSTTSRCIHAEVPPPNDVNPTLRNERNTLSNAARRSLSPSSAVNGPLSPCFVRHSLTAAYLELQAERKGEAALPLTRWFRAG